MFDDYSYPCPPEEGKINVATAIILTLVTCGIYGFVWQYRQMNILNDWLDREEFSFWSWLFLSIITCGLYSIYNEYKMAKAIVEIQETRDFRESSDLPMICVFLSIFGLHIVSTAIQQNEINKFYGNDAFDQF